MTNLLYETDDRKLALSVYDALRQRLINNAALTLELHFAGNTCCLKSIPNHGATASCREREAYNVVLSELLNYTNAFCDGWAARKNNEK